MDYSVRLTFTGEVEEERIFDLAERLAGPYSASVSHGITEFAVQLAVTTVDRIGFAAVLHNVVEDVSAIARDVGITDFELVETSVMDWARFEAELERPTFPHMIGVSELAEILKVSKARASELARFPGFPAPLQVLKSGPVWIEDNVRHFAETWVRKPGRPKKLTAADLSAVEGASMAARNWHREDMSDPLNELGSPG